MTEFFNEINFESVISTQNPDVSQMDSAWLEIKNLAWRASKGESPPTLLYVYYGGHGVMQNTTFMVLNEADPYQRFFDLEQRLQTLSKFANFFVVGIFDCCREPLPDTFKSIQSEVDSNSSGDQNLYITFGSVPLKGVLASSTLAKNYIKCIKDHLNKTGGVLEIPSALAMKFKSRYEKSSSERTELTKELFYDVTREGQERVTTTFSVTTPAQKKRADLVKQALLKRISAKKE